MIPALRSFSFRRFSLFSFRSWHMSLLPHHCHRQILDQMLCHFKTARSEFWPQACHDWLQSSVYSLIIVTIIAVKKHGSIWLPWLRLQRLWRFANPFSIKRWPVTRQEASSQNEIVAVRCVPVWRKLMKNVAKKSLGKVCSLYSQMPRDQEAPGFLMAMSQATTRIWL